MNKLYCYNRWAFENLCKSNGWDINNIPSDAAFISICGTHDVQEVILEDEEYHYFDIYYHPQVLNLDFDDVTEEIREIPEHPKKYCFGINERQAEEAVEFISRNIGKDFYIHCRAGHSRSQAFVRYILDLYEGIIDFEIREDNPPTQYNVIVLLYLKRAAKKSGEYWRCCLLQYGITIESIKQTDEETILKIPNAEVRVKKNGAVEIIDDASGKIKEYKYFEEFLKALNP